MLIRRAVLLSAGEVIDAEDLALEARGGGSRRAPARSGLSLAEMERDYIETVLREHDGHRGRAARSLGIDPRTLSNKLTREPRRK